MTSEELELLKKIEETFKTKKISIQYEEFKKIRESSKLKKIITDFLKNKIHDKEYYNLVTNGEFSEILIETLEGEEWYNYIEFILEGNLKEALFSFSELEELIKEYNIDEVHAKIYRKMLEETFLDPNAIHKYFSFDNDFVESLLKYKRFDILSIGKPFSDYSLSDKVLFEIKEAWPDNMEYPPYLYRICKTIEDYNRFSIQTLMSNILDKSLISNENDKLIKDIIDVLIQKLKNGEYFDINKYSFDKYTEFSESMLYIISNFESGMELTKLFLERGVYNYMSLISLNDQEKERYVKIAIDKYFDKYYKEKTKINYDDKLKKYLKYGSIKNIILEKINQGFITSFNFNDNNLSENDYQFLTSILKLKPDFEFSFVNNSFYNFDRNIYLVKLLIENNKVKELMELLNSDNYLFLNILKDNPKIKEIIKNDFELTKIFVNNFLKNILNFYEYNSYIPFIEDIILNYLNSSYCDYSLFSNIKIPSGYSSNIINICLSKNIIKSIEINNNINLYNESDIKLIEKILSYQKDVKINYLFSKCFEENNLFIETLLKYDRIEEVLNLSSIELINQLIKDGSLSLDKIRNDSNYLNLFFTKVIPFLKDEDILIDIVSTPDIAKKLINKAQELNIIDIYTEKLYQKLRPFIKEIYSFDILKLDKIEKLVGPKIIGYLDNTNIKLLLNLTNENIDKFILLFPQTEYTMDNIKDSFTSLKQLEFANTKQEIVNIFSLIIEAINEDNEDMINFYLYNIVKKVDKEEVINLFNIYNIQYGDYEYFYQELKHIAKMIKESKENLKYKSLLHDISSYYIRKSREEYEQNSDFKKELNLDYRLDPKESEIALIKGIFKVRISGGIFSNYRDELINYLTNFIERPLLLEVIDYYTKKTMPTLNDINSVTKNIGLFVKETKKFIKSNKIPDDIKSIIISRSDFQGEIKRLYYVQEGKPDLASMISKINIPIFTKYVLSDKEVYDSLLLTMKKRKLHKLPKKLIDKFNDFGINLPYNFDNFSSFFTYYARIYHDEKNRLIKNGKQGMEVLLNLEKILLNADLYGNSNFIYNIILSKEDAKLIKTNPGPYSARMLSTTDRLKKAVEDTKKLFRRNVVTVPPIVKDISFKGTDGENKKMHVVVANYTSPCNLTHGERTGACMRIGGHADSLFHFCIENKNGFHIRFEDPIFHEYISRVSGFRNGNTVFLNELRYSLNKGKYSDEDVIKVCEEIAKLIVLESKESSYPIDNVVIYKAYAMGLSSKDAINLNILSSKEGYPNFYSDINNSGILLASSREDNSLVPINFDKDNLPSYKPARCDVTEYEYITEYNLEKIKEKVNRITSVKKLLAGFNFEYLDELWFEYPIKYAVIGDDWYIVIDENNKVFSDNVGTDDRSLLEMDEYKLKVEEIIGKGNNYGL